MKLNPATLVRAKFFEGGCTVGYPLIATLKFEFGNGMFSEYTIVAIFTDEDYVLDCWFGSSIEQTMSRETFANLLALHETNILYFNFNHDIFVEHDTLCVGSLNILIADANRENVKELLQTFVRELRKIYETCEEIKHHRT